MTDDAPQSVQEVRRKFFAVRLKLLNSGVNREDVWVTKSIPPLLCIRQCPNTEPLKVTVDKVNKNFMDSVLAHIPHRVDNHRGGIGNSVVNRNFFLFFSYFLYLICLKVGLDARRDNLNKMKCSNKITNEESFFVCFFLFCSSSCSLERVFA